MTTFVISKFFEIPTHAMRAGSRVIREEELKKFWAGPAHEYSRREGCYIFLMTARRGVRPWYVGMTAVNFKREAFANISRYNETIGERKEARPYMCFVVSKQKRSKTSEKKIRELESYLIISAYKKNKELINKYGTKKRRSWSIRGILSQVKGPQSEEVKMFKRMMRRGSPRR